MYIKFLIKITLCYTQVLSENSSEWFPTHFMMPTSVWYKKQTLTVQQQKLQTNSPHEHELKITQNFSNWIQQYIEMIIHSDDVRSILRGQSWLNMQKSINIIRHFNKLKRKNHMPLSINTEKAFVEIQQPLRKLAVEGNFLNLIKLPTPKSGVNIIRKGEKKVWFLCTIEKGQECLPFYLVYWFSYGDFS